MTGIPEFAESVKPELQWAHLSKAGQSCPTIAEAIAEKVERLQRFRAANPEIGRRGRPRRAAAQPLDTIPYQIRSPVRRRFECPPSDDVQAIVGAATGLRQAFPELVPARPYCTDDPSSGVAILRKSIALRKRHIQLDPPKLIRWLPFDVDRPDACFASESASLPAPNFVAVNPENGHSLTAYLLAVPVRKFDGSHRGPIEYLAAIERGFRRRLGADPGYSGLIAKNPLHPHWRVDWPMPRPYEMGELAGALDKRDMRPEPKSETLGLGRNCSIFDDARHWAYRNVLDFKRAGAAFERWEARLLQVVQGHNLIFSDPLPHSELRHIAKSIAKWTWRRFSVERFSALQSFRVKKRWAGHIAAETTKPWEALGISRRTYYRRKKRGNLK